MSRAQDSITDGSLSRPLFKLAWPIVITQLLQVAYNLIDTIWLGRVSTAAVGALSLALPVSVLVISISGRFTVAGSTFVAQYTGAGGDGSAEKVAGQTISFVAVLAVVLGILGHFLAEPMLALYLASAESAETVVPIAGRYLRLLFLGTPFIFGFHVFSALMRGYGNMRLPMRVMTVSVLLNVVLDPLLIFGGGPITGMGVEGVALATVLSRGAATVVGLVVLFGTDYGPNVRLGHLVPNRETIWDIVRIGTPSALEESAGALAMLTLTAVIITFSPPVMAAYGLGNRVVSLVFLPAVGLGRATNTMVGQNLGAGNVERAERAVWLAAKAGCAVMIGVAVVAAVFPRPLVGVFLDTGTAEAEATLAFAGNYLQLRTIEFAFIGLFHVLVGAYRGAGNTKTAMAFSMVTLWFCRVPLVYYLAIVRDLGPTGIWLGVTLGHVVGAIAAGLWFTRGTWKRAVIDSADIGGTTGSGADD